MEKINAIVQMKDFWKASKEQLSHHWFILILFMFLAISAHSLIMSLFGLVLDIESLGYQILSLVTNFAVVIFSNTVLFLLIKRVRKEEFHVSDIIFSMKMFIYHVVMALFLSIVQLFVQMMVMMTAVVPILYYIIAYIPTAFFLFWNGIIAFAIYDNDRKLGEYISGGARMLLVNWKFVLLLSIPYVISGYAISALATTLYTQAFADVSDFTNIAGSIAASGDKALIIAAMYLIYYLLQAVVQVVLLQMIANMYDSYFHLYFPSLADKQKHK